MKVLHRTETIRTDSGVYQIQITETDPARPYAAYLHGGPGFNSYPERAILGPLLQDSVNLVWIDSLGCASSPAIAPDKILLKNEHSDIAHILRQVVGKPLHLIGHCWSVETIRGVLEIDPTLARTVSVISPMKYLSDIFKTVVRRALEENQLNPQDFTAAEMSNIHTLLGCEDQKFGSREIDLFLRLAFKMKNFHVLYWSDPEAMNRYLALMSEKKFVPETFVSILRDYFTRPHRPILKIGGIPTLFIRSDEDRIAPWEQHGKYLAELNPQAQIKTIPDGFHWIHLQKPEACARELRAFFGSN